MRCVEGPPPQQKDLAVLLCERLSHRLHPTGLNSGQKVVLI